MFLALVILLAVAAGSWQPAATSTPAMVSPAPAVSPVAAPAGELGGGGAGARRDQDREFVRGCCARTLYPRLCTAALSPYAAAVGYSHARLAVPSANLTAGTINSLGGRIPSPSTTGTTESPDGALGDCAEAVASAADLAARAAGRLDGVERAVAGPEVLWRVRDAQTLLSVAMTYEGTCADALRPAASAPTPVRAELRAGVRRAMQHTSIALALVHMLIRTSA
ncbi:pectinesterase inhibitor 9-like [Oryza glaberrima]|uniref:pectinesterase inhibitor 9-like n=1 Tax=Oryza glaberrima TaxID=4538 RepID=UPI00224C43A0|nr:pectinesterase inhibitor 9-like [Oryza glaberrima]